MQTFALLWWLWLLLSTVCYGYALFNQLRRVKRMMTAPFEDDSFAGFFSGIGGMIVASLLGSASLIALLVSAVYWLIVAAG